MRLLPLVVLLISCVTQAAVADTGPKRAACPGVYDDWSDVCFKAKGSATFVKPRHRKHLSYGRDGHASVMTRSSGLVAINRQGKVVMTHIAFAGDFDFRDAQAGVSRYAAGTDRNKLKCGYFQVKTYKVVIPAVYDHCSAFHDGRARVCVGCTIDCGDDDDCHVEEYVGGEGLILNLTGKVLERRALPALPTCPLSPAPEAVAKPCRPNPNASLLTPQ